MEEDQTDGIHEARTLSLAWDSGSQELGKVGVCMCGVTVHGK